MSDRMTGKCLCGAVSFTFTPKEPHADVCHCKMCQRWNGGPGFSVMADGTAEVSGTEHVDVYKSSEWGERHFCKICGSNLFYAAPDYGYFGVCAGAIDDTSGLALTMEIYTDSQPAYYSFAQPTKRLTEAEFTAMLSGGSKEEG